MSAPGGPPGARPAAPGGPGADGHPGGAPTPAEASALVPALVLLTVVTGVVDAVSFLGLGHVFTANMTGNVVFLGFGLAGGGAISVAGAAVALVAFGLGAVLGGRLHVRVGGAAHRRLRAAMAVELVLVAAAALVALGLDAGGLHGRGFAVVVLLALAMGLRNAVVRRLGVLDLTTTVLTLTITGLGSDSPAAGGTPVRSGRRIASVVAMFAGALVGGLLVLGPGMAAALGVAALAVALALVVPGLGPRPAAPTPTRERPRESVPGPRGPV